MILIALPRHTSHTLSKPGQMMIRRSPCSLLVLMAPTQGQPSGGTAIPRRSGAMPIRSSRTMQPQRGREAHPLCQGHMMRSSRMGPRPVLVCPQSPRLELCRPGARVMAKLQRVGSDLGLGQLSCQQGSGCRQVHRKPHLLSSTTQSWAPTLWLNPAPGMCYHPWGLQLLCCRTCSPSHPYHKLECLGLALNSLHRKLHQHRSRSSQTELQISSWGLS